MVPIMETITVTNDGDYKIAHIYMAFQVDRTLWHLLTPDIHRNPPDEDRALIIQGREGRNVNSLAQCHTANKWQGDLWG